jgi:hypothetical protein
MLIAIIAAVFIVSILGTNWFRPDLLGISQYHWIYIAAGAYILIVALSWIRGLNYFYFDDNGDKIHVRYYPIRPLGRKKKAIQIPKIVFAGYEIRRTSFGLRKVIILKQHHKKSVVNYPPVSITMLTRAEQEMLEKQLAAYIR